MQTTINSRISFTGRGLHSGKECQATLFPAAADTGIVFRNADIDSKPEFVAHPRNLFASNLCSTLGDGEENKIQTVEHLLAALFVLGIDNLVIEVGNSEIPILDGSSLPFVEKIRACGVKDLHVPRKRYGVKRELVYQQRNSRIELAPAERLSFHCRISFDNPVIGDQAVDFYFDQDDYMDVCRSRTFCLLDDVAAMREKDLALGGSIDNAIVVGDRVMNPGGLRMEKEFAYHKLLDFFGDLNLLTYQVVGRFSLYQPGHDVNTKFVTRLFQNAKQHLYELGADRAALLSRRGHAGLNSAVAQAGSNG